MSTIAPERALTKAWPPTVTLPSDRNLIRLQEEDFGSVRCHDKGMGVVPYWSIYCVFCSGYIVDALLECIPAGKRSDPAFRLLFKAELGAALACPYCNGLIGFDEMGAPRIPEPGWPVFRYGQAELELKKG